MGAGVGEGGRTQIGDDGRDPDRWIAARDRSRQVVCIGDSTTRTWAGEKTWVDHVAAGLGAPGDPKPAEGFRGIWRTREWSRQGTWRRTTAVDAFDAAPFGFGYVSSGDPADALTWTRPAGAPVAAFDVYTMVASGLGRAQYRVDDGAWRDVDPPATAGSRLTRTSVRQPVHERVQLRAGDGSRSSVVAAAGLDIFGTAADEGPRTRVHHLGIGMQNLHILCRRTAGDRLALLDLLRPEMVIVSMTNDIVWAAPDFWDSTLRDLQARVEPYAELLLISSFEQRPPRRVDDAVTRAGSTRLRSGSAAFVASDVTAVVRGTNLLADPETTIVSVVSGTEVVLSAPPTASGGGGELVIGRGREVEMQAAYRATTRRVAASVGCRHLDLYEAWCAAGVQGWEAADQAGLMLDRIHATAEGHRDIAARVLDLLERPVDPAASPVGGEADPVSSPLDGLPELVPGVGSIVAPTAGTAVLLVPVTLSGPAAEPVTVRWRTLLVDDGEIVQAPRTDYVPDSGWLTFDPGQRQASVAITVRGNSTGEDETIVVRFSEPTQARLGGYWGLGFGVVAPPP
jgi:hypothetical protein